MVASLVAAARTGMRRTLSAALLCLLAGLASAAHITDKLVIGLYEQPDLSDKPKRLLTSGTPIEVLEQKKGKARVRLGDGITGWIEARYVSEAKPAAMALLEAQAEIRRLKKQLEKPGMVQGTSDTRPLPSAEKTRLGLELGKARERIAELERSLADLPRLEAAVKERDALAARLEAIREALGDERKSTQTGPEERKGAERGWWLWLGAVGLLMFGFGAGVFFIKQRISRRFRGLRI
ncbi:MAG: TIGR04211 family SH3 domain-containing protein [Gammaproteobacteria bacterium]|nr:MAG: TIGR04211 family SH3 domain-containing protein [Gammaproteobacteria bacterium]